MKRIHRFVLFSYFGPLVMTFFIVLFILIMQFLWKYIDDLVGKGLDIVTLGELLFYFTISFMPMALPLAILLAALMTFGNMGENLELTALKSAGISLQRIMLPLILFIILISIGAFFFSNNVLPHSNLKSRSLLFDIQKQRPELNIQPGSFYNGINGFSIKIAEKDPGTNLMHKILIYDHRDKIGNVSVTYADSGYMSITPNELNLIFNLYNGHSYTELQQDNRNKNKTYPHRRDRFSEETVIFDLTGFGLNRSNEDLYKSHYSMLNLDGLEHYRDSFTIILNDRKEVFTKTMMNANLFKFPNFDRKRREKENIKVDSTKKFRPREILDELINEKQKHTIELAIAHAKSAKKNVADSQRSIVWRAKTIKRYEIEWQRKFTLSFACFIFFFIGAPLGAIIRKGGLGTPVVVSVLFFVVYYVITLMGEKFAREMIVTPFEGMWASSFILLPLGIFLTYKATTDSVIMNTETYTEIPKRIIQSLKKIMINNIPGDRVNENPSTDK